MNERPRVKARLLSYFDEHPGQLLQVEKVADGTGLTVKQVQTGMNNLRREQPEFATNIESIINGQVWRYNPAKHDNGPFEVEDLILPPSNGTPKKVAKPTKPTKPTKEMLAIIGSSVDGTLICQDRFGIFYKATKLT